MNNIWQTLGADKTCKLWTCVDKIAHSQHCVQVRDNSCVLLSVTSLACQNWEGIIIKPSVQHLFLFIQYLKIMLKTDCVKCRTLACHHCLTVHCTIWSLRWFTKASPSYSSLCCCGWGSTAAWYCSEWCCGWALTAVPLSIPVSPLPLQLSDLTFASSRSSTPAWKMHTHWHNIDSVGSEQRDTLEIYANNDFSTLLKNVIINSHIRCL